MIQKQLTWSPKWTVVLFPQFSALRPLFNTAVCPAFAVVKMTRSAVTEDHSPWMVLPDVQDAFLLFCPCLAPFCFTRQTANGRVFKNEAEVDLRLLLPSNLNSTFCSVKLKINKMYIKMCPCVYICSQHTHPRTDMSQLAHGNSTVFHNALTTSIENVLLKTNIFRSYVKLKHITVHKSNS